MKLEINRKNRAYKLSLATLGVEMAAKSGSPVVAVGDNSTFLTTMLCLIHSDMATPFTRPPLIHKKQPHHISINEYQMGCSICQERRILDYITKDAVIPAGNK